MCTSAIKDTVFCTLLISSFKHPSSSAAISTEEEDLTKEINFSVFITTDYFSFIEPFDLQQTKEGRKKKKRKDFIILFSSFFLPRHRSETSPFRQAFRSTTQKGDKFTNTSNLLARKCFILCPPHRQCHPLPPSNFDVSRRFY